MNTIGHVKESDPQKTMEKTKIINIEDKKKSVYVANTKHLYASSIWDHSPVINEHRTNSGDKNNESESNEIQENKDTERSKLFQGQGLKLGIILYSIIFIVPISILHQKQNPLE